MKRLKMVFVPVLLAGVLLAGVFAVVRAASDVFDFSVDGEQGWGVSNSRCLWAGTNANNTGVPYDDSWACNPRSTASNSAIVLTNQSLLVTPTITNVLGAIVDYGWVDHDDYPDFGVGILGKAIQFRVQCRGMYYYSDAYVIGTVTGQVEFTIDYDLDDPCPWSADLLSNTTVLYVDSLHNGSNENAGMSFWRVEVLGDAGVPEPPEPPGQYITSTIIAGGLCAFTLTLPITDSNGVTGTVTTTYTRPANLLSNPSFETAAGSYPEHWATGVNGAVQDVPGIWWVNSAAYANTGSRSISNIADYQAIQMLPLYSAGHYVVGFYARCPSGSCDPIQARWNGTVAVAALSASSTYTVFTGTYSTGGGAAWFAVEFQAGPSSYVDNVFVYPTDESGTGAINCDPDYYPPEDIEFDTTPPHCVLDAATHQCIYAPTGPAGSTCYYCAIPDGAASFGVWIAYLACVLRNMFSCSLRVWLFDLSNSLRGIMATLIMVVNWTNTTAVNGVAWSQSRYTGFLNYLLSFWSAYGSYVSTAPRQVVVVVNTTIQQVDEGIDWLSIIIEIIQVLFGLFVSLLHLMYEGSLGLINLIIYAIRNLQTALSAPPFDLVRDFANPSPQDGMMYPNATTDNAIARLIMAMAVIDVSITDYHAWPALYTVAGLVGITTIIWIIRQWKDDIFPI